MNEQNLATELLAEVKTSAKRWFIVSLVELAIILISTVAFLWYVSLPTEESHIEYSQEADNNNMSDVQQFIGEHQDGESKTDGP